MHKENPRLHLTPNLYDRECEIYYGNHPNYPNCPKNAL